MIEITDFGRFHAVELPGDPVLYFRTDDGQDWYEMQRALARWSRDTGQFINSVYGCWALVNDGDEIVGVDKDPTKLVPHFHRVLGIDADPADIRMGMFYKNGVIA
jgi:hypothetical protein